MKRSMIVVLATLALSGLLALFTAPATAWWPNTWTWMAGSPGVGLGPTASSGYWGWAAVAPPAPTPCCSGVTVGQTPAGHFTSTGHITSGAWHF